MDAPLRVLIIEDSEDDAALLRRELQRGGFAVIHERVEAEPALREALANATWDVVLCDYSQPQFSAVEALEVLRQTELDLPFIIVSGNIGEATAVALMKAGAHGYLMKDNLARLVPVVKRELQEAGVRREAVAAKRERVASVAALRESEARYHTLVDSIPQMMWTLTPDGRADYFNRRWFEYTGLTPEQVAGLQWLAAVHPDDIQGVQEHRARNIAAAQAYEYEVRFKGAGGKYRWHLVRVVPLRPAMENRILMWLGTATDIHDIKRAEEARARLLDSEQQARAAAEAANRAKDEFLATLSHELRTPLTPILGWVRMMRQGMLNAEMSERGLAVIDSNAQSLTRLINDLLDLSAIINGKMRIEKSLVPLDAVINEAVETVRPQAAKRQVRIELAGFKDDATAPVLISGDRTRLVQVFWNLLNNAVKFSDEGGLVRVRCAADDKTASIEVEDQGQGIAPEFLPYIFERFRQADASSTRLYGGMGIGLALVKSFIEAHDGTVRGASEGAGHGSCFCITLPRLHQSSSPIAAASIMTAQAALESAKAADAPKKRALIIEDAPDTLDMLRATIEARGYQAVSCESAREALRLAASMCFDIIVSDVGLPDADGHELLKELRELPHLRHTPAIALTGYAAQHDIDRALAAGFDAHLAKPVDPAQLIARMGYLLSAPRAAGNV